EIPVKLVEVAVKGLGTWGKAASLRTLGAALYRAGRHREAILSLSQAISERNGIDEPLEWPFLAMAHHQLGHRDEARRWIDKLRYYHPRSDPDNFWGDLQIRQLQSEAEAVILYDPVFPADPFAD